MKRKVLSLLAILYVLDTCAPPAWSQDLRVRSGGVESAKFPQLTARVSVSGNKGQPVPGLTRDAFSVTEGGKPVEGLSIAPDDSPVTVALVIDNSEGLERSMAQVKAAIVGFVKHLGGKDKVSLITFDDHPRHVADTEASRAELLTGVQKMEASGGRSLFDGLLMALKRLGDNGERRAVICVTLGMDRNEEGTGAQSAATAKQVVELSRERGLPLSIICLDHGKDKVTLAKVAALTGGQPMVPKDVTILGKALQKSLENATAGYKMNFVSPAPVEDGTARKLEITATFQGRKGKCPAGYKAPAPAAPSPSAGEPEEAPAVTGPILGPEFVEKECGVSGKTSDSISPIGGGDSPGDWELTADTYHEYEWRPRTSDWNYYIETRWIGAKVIEIPVQAKLEGTGPRGLDLHKYVHLVAEDGRKFRTTDSCRVNLPDGETTSPETLSFPVPRDVVPTMLLFTSENREFPLSGGPAERPVPQGWPKESYFASSTLDEYREQELPFTVTVRHAEQIGAVQYWAGDHFDDQNKLVDCTFETYRPYPGWRFVALTFDIKARPEATVEDTWRGEGGLRLLQSNRLIIKPFYLFEVPADRDYDRSALEVPYVHRNIEPGKSYLGLYGVETGEKNIEILYEKIAMGKFDLPADPASDTKSTTSN